MISWPTSAARTTGNGPSTSFQQFGQVYWRHDMQKLKVLWKASSWLDVTSRSVSLRAAAIASSIDVSSDMTKFLRPRDRTLTPLEPRRCGRGGFEGVARAAAFAEGFGQDLGHRVPGIRADDVRAGRAARTGREYSAGIRAPLHRGYRAEPRMVRVRREGRRASGGPLVDSATDHAAPHRHRAVLRTPLRAPVGSPVPHARLQPVQLQRRIERAMEAERLRDLRSDRSCRTGSSSISTRTTSTAFGDMTRTLASELADGALAFARAHHYTLVDRPRVDLSPTRPSTRADIRVDARFADPIAGRAGHGPRRRHRPPARADRRRRPDRHDGLHGARDRASPRARSGSSIRDGRIREVVVDGRRPDHRPGDRQRPRGSRRRASPATTAGSPAGAGRSSTPTSAARTARGSTASRSPRSCSGSGDRLQVGDTALVVEVAGALD